MYIFTLCIVCIEKQQLLNKTVDCNKTKAFICMLNNIFLFIYDCFSTFTISDNIKFVSLQEFIHPLTKTLEKSLRNKGCI